MVCPGRRRRKGVLEIRTMRHLWNGRGRPAATTGPRPWVFVASRDRRGTRVLVRVHAMMEAHKRVQVGADELVVFYRLPGLEKETIHVELKGDVLVLQARGLHRKTLGGFGVHDEVLLPHVVPGSETTHAYSGDVLEVRIVPSSTRSSRERRGPTHGRTAGRGGEHD